MKKFITIIILICLLINSSNKFIMAKDKEVKNSLTICIDPGHQKKRDSKLEPIAPDSSNKKPRVSQGTEGVGSKKAEYVGNLEASLL